MFQDIYSNITKNMNMTTGNITNETCVPWRDSPSPVEEPKASEIFRIVVMSFIVFFSIVGNALVLRGAIRRRNRPFVYYLVINLCIVEIIIGVLRCFMIFDEIPPFFWEFGEFLCHLVNGSVICTALVLSFTLAAIAVFRAVVMIQPKRNRPSKRFAYSIMALSWIWGTCFAIPYGLKITLLISPDPCIPTKIFKICRRTNDHGAFDISYFIAFFLIPFLLMSGSYGIVIYKIKQHIHSEAGARKESLELTSVTTTRGNSIEIEGRMAQSLASRSQFSPNNPNRLSVTQGLSNEKEQSKGKRFKLEKDVLNLLYILILVFFICYLPWIIWYILKVSAKEESAKNWPYAKIFEWYMSLAYGLPSALHPICYGAASKVIDISFSKYFRWPCNKVV